MLHLLTLTDPSAVGLAMRRLIRIPGEVDLVGRLLSVGVNAFGRTS